MLNRDIIIIGAGHNGLVAAYQPQMNADRRGSEQDKAFGSIVG